MRVERKAYVPCASLLDAKADLETAKLLIPVRAKTIHVSNNSKLCRASPKYSLHFLAD